MIVYLQECLGSKGVVHVDHVLPQYQHPDVIICFDNSNNPIPLSSTLSKIPFGSVKYPPKLTPEDIKWLALIMGSNNSYARNTNRLLGHISAKYRQLEHIGYTPHVVIIDRLIRKFVHSLDRILILYMFYRYSGKIGSSSRTTTRNTST